MTHYFVGIVELVTESDTLRKIQVSSGVTGSFKDRPIKEWLQKHNPTELEYQKASICYGAMLVFYAITCTLEPIETKP